VEVAPADEPAPAAEVSVPDSPADASPAESTTAPDAGDHSAAAAGEEA
jgi:hypothetical protein